MATTPLDPHQHARRYSRHFVLPDFGPEGQAMLASTHVLVVGAGGLGSPALTYLAASGIGRITLLDDDRVDLSNLPRQILFEDGDVTRLKVDAARDRLEELNPALQLTTHATTFEAAYAAQPHLLDGVTLLVDGSDNFATRIAVNHAALRARIPLVSGAIIGWSGQVASFAGHRDATPCYQCLVGDTPNQTDTCQSNGVISPLGGVIGSMMALEVIRHAAGVHTPLYGRLLQLDAQSMQWRESRIVKDPACTACGTP